MKDGIHPDFGPTDVTCSCGNKFTVGSTLKKPLSIETCSECHPYFKGTLKTAAVTATIDKFNKKYARYSAATRSK